MFTGDERSLGKDLPKSWEFTANAGHLLRACAAGPRGWRTAWGTAGRAGRLGKSVNKKQYFKVLFLRFTLCSKSIHLHHTVSQQAAATGSRIPSHAPR